jgi:hypothetical protein
VFFFLSWPVFWLLCFNKKNLKKTRFGWAAALIFLGYAVFMVWYLLIDPFYSHLEPTIVSNSWMMYRGVPLYHDLSSWQRTSLLYGPMLNIIQVGSMLLLGPSVFSAKMPTVLALFFAIAELAILFRREFKSVATFGILILILQLMIFEISVFCAKADGLLFYFAVSALFAALIPNFIISSLMIGFALGVSVNLKIHAPLYFIPIIALYLSRHSSSGLFLSAVVAIAMAIIPFSIIPQISFPHYWEWLKVAAHHGFHQGLFLWNLEFAFFFLLPAYYFSTHQSKTMLPRSFRIFLFSLIFATASVIFIASKDGAGPGHLIPLLPAFLYATVFLYHMKVDFLANRKSYAFLVAFIFTLAIFGFKNSAYAAKQIYPYAVKNISQDLQAITKSNPTERIAMGYGGDYALTWYRPVLTFQDHPQWLDAAALMDMQAAGIEMPPSTQAAMESCKTTLWLIPKWGRPFDQKNFYDSKKQLFSVSFKQAFLQRYEMKKRTPYYDLWYCKGRA